MANEERTRVSRFYKIKNKDGNFDDYVFFGTYGKYVIVRRPDSSENGGNYQNLQTCLDELNKKIKSTITWTNFS